MSENSQRESESRDNPAVRAERTVGERMNSAKTRRQFGKAGFAGASVLATLSSRPVWGAQCLSNILSGNLSDPQRGRDNCDTGYSPKEWREMPSMWPPGVTYGTCDTTVVATCASCAQYTGGTKFRDLFGHGTTRPIRDLLCKNPNWYVSHLAAAALNAMTMPGYSMSREDVLDIYDGVIMGDKGKSEIKAILRETWIA